jgi:hypothetical protein
MLVAERVVEDWAIHAHRRGQIVERSGGVSKTPESVGRAAESGVWVERSRATALGWRLLHV